jgi:hypothetical protein
LAGILPSSDRNRPLLYGDKIAAEVSGPDGGPIQQNVNFRFFDDKPPEK